MVKGFAEEYREDAFSLDEDDSQWLKYKSRPMTECLRRVRAMAGKRIISVRVDHRYYFQQGLDIETWIHEGLIDILIVAEESLGGYVFDLKPYVKMVGNSCKLLFGEEVSCSGHDLTAEEDRALAMGKKIDVSRRSLTIEEYCRRALKWYEERCPWCSYLQ
ncbi:hypothetical protein J7M02_07990 [Candidatus Aerophobetes bacterium]|nr:hypothetical protein [Candidatus Aerophobetes bacterium]